MTEFTTDQSPVPYIQKVSALQLMLESLCQAIGIDHESPATWFFIMSEWTAQRAHAFTVQAEGRCGGRQPILTQRRGRRHADKVKAPKPKGAPITSRTVEL